jgi:hypothetical protein
MVQNDHPECNECGLHQTLSLDAELLHGQVIESIEWSEYHSADEFLRKNIVGVLLIIKMLIVGWLPLALLGFHTYLIMSNQTTWEFNVRARITYLRGIPEGFNPFSQGCLGNIELTCCDFDPEPKHWRTMMKSPPPTKPAQK